MHVIRIREQLSRSLWSTVMGVEWLTAFRYPSE
jgi:hypothetical protein